jgi:adenosylcobinamide-GDP ribazoletransferase
MHLDRSQYVRWRDAALAAFQLLTRLPVSVKLDYSDAVFRRSVVFYPLVGGVIGLLLAAATAVLTHAVPVFPAAAVLLAVWVGLTGALHLDGLMDTADGLLSNRSRERMLEIMKDSRVGAMGVAVCALTLLMKLSFVYTLLNFGGGRSLLLLAAVPVWSRWFMALSMRIWPYAGGSQGMGSFYAGLKKRHAAASTCVAFSMSLVLYAVFPGSGPAVLWILILFPAAAFLGGGLIARWMSAKLGGLTGDTYGALNELLETMLLFLAIILCNLG